MKQFKLFRMVSKLVISSKCDPVIASQLQAWIDNN